MAPAIFAVTLERASILLLVITASFRLGTEPQFAGQYYGYCFDHHQTITDPSQVVYILGVDTGSHIIIIMKCDELSLFYVLLLSHIKLSILTEHLTFKSTIS